MYVNDNDSSDGCWIYFDDGHLEYWNNTRLQNELNYRGRGLKLLKTQIKLLAKYKLFHDHVANHKEVKEAPINKGKVMCKVCNKTFDEIINK